jgi:hypothetical protein
MGISSQLAVVLLREHRYRPITGSILSIGRFDFIVDGSTLDEEDNGRLTYFGQDRYYHPWREALAVAIAEKGPASSWERSPVQFEYRSTSRFEDRDGKREIAHQTVPNDTTDAYVLAALRFHRSQRPALFAPTEKISLPSEFLHYSPETPYCGSLLPIEQQ